MNGGTEMDVREKLIELLTNSQQLDCCDEKELAYKTGWNDALMALIENRPIETNGNNGLLTTAHR